MPIGLTRLKESARSPLAWATLLYFAMGIPFNAINGTASIMLKSLGFSDADNTVLIGSIVIVWSLKPAWSAFLDLFSLHRAIIISAELLCAVIFAAISIVVLASTDIILIVVLLWLGAFVSATLDLCADGLILTAATPGQQSKAVGLLGLGWHAGKIFASGLVIILAGFISDQFHLDLRQNWAVVWLLIAGTLILTVLAGLKALPHAPPRSGPTILSGAGLFPAASFAEVRAGLGRNIVSIFEKPHFWGMMAFILLYRLSEGLIISEGRLFIQTPPASGGMGLTPAQTSLIDGVFGSAAYVAGGLLGGGLLGRFGLKRSIIPFALAMNIPHIGYLFLSLVDIGDTPGLIPVGLVVIIEKFGYGLGFSACTLYMMQEFAPGSASMTHYAFATALMNLALVPTSTASGPLADQLGFPLFFALVAFASVPAIMSAIYAPFARTGEDVSGLVTPAVAMRRLIGFSQGIGTMIVLTWALALQQLIAERAILLGLLSILFIVNCWASVHLGLSRTLLEDADGNLSTGRIDFPLTASLVTTSATGLVLVFFWGWGSSA